MIKLRTLFVAAISLMSLWVAYVHYCHRGSVARAFLGFVLLSWIGGKTTTIGRSFANYISKNGRDEETAECDFWMFAALLVALICLWVFIAAFAFK